MSSPRRQGQAPPGPLHASPLSEAESLQLDSTLLPSLERHHLRLLAHGLRTLQAVAQRQEGPLPPQAQLQAWIASQPGLAEDPDFARTFSLQLENLGHQLSRIAAGAGCSPLALTLEQLCAWALAEADQRLGEQQGHTGQHQ